MPEESTTNAMAMTSERAPKGRLLRCVNYLPPWRVTLTVIACMITEATLGVTYTSGNLLPYLTSYLRNVTGEASVDYGEMLWVYNTSWLVVSASLCFMGLLERRIPNRLYIFSGICLNAIAFFGSYWAIQTSFILFIIIYGAVQGFAQSILYPNALNLALKWFPHRKGLIAGITMGGYGGGAFIWNQVATRWINPHNLQPDLADGESRYFTQPGLLHRVPTCFLVLGGLLVGVQLLCLLCLSYPDPQTPSQTTEIDDTANSEKKEIQNSNHGDTTFTLEKHIQESEPGHSRQDTTAGSELLDSTSETCTFNSEPYNSSTRENIPPPNSDKLDILPQSTSSLGYVKYIPDSDFANTTTQKYVPYLENYSKTGLGKGNKFLASLKNEKESLRGNDDDVIGDGEEHDVISLVTEKSVVKIPQYSPLDVVKQRITWTIWLNNLSTDYTFVLILGFYKAYGQTFIPNDHFLALVASFASVFNAIGRPIWGLIADRIGYLPAMLLTQAVLFVSTATFLLCELAGSAAMFFTWVCVMFSAFSGIYSLQSPILFTLFGPRNFIFVLGVITTTGIPVTLSSAMIAKGAMAAFGWRGLFLLSASFTFIALLFLSSILLSCGHPIAPHMRRGLMVPVRSVKHKAQQRATVA